MGENPNAEALVRQTWELWRESMRLARNVLREGRPPQVKAGEPMEHYYAQVPMIAAHIFDRMLSHSAFLKQAPERDQQECVESISVVVREVAALSTKVEKEMEPEE